MKVHHLNCGTMHPWGAPDGLVCHVLLVETPNGLVLIDSGLGLRDRAAPAQRFGPARHFVRPVFDESETAIRQVQSLGYHAADVTDIVLTHFDADHIGGLADFPHARVHLTAKEDAAMTNPGTLIENRRYLPAGHDHGPILVTHDPAQGDMWRGFARATELTDIADGIVLIGLPGHSRGHAAIAVDARDPDDPNAPDRWVLHIGDSLYHHGQIDGSGHTPRSLTAMERAIAYDWTQVRANHLRLRELWAEKQPDLVIVNAHCPTLLRRARESG